MSVFKFKVQFKYETELYIVRTSNIMKYGRFLNRRNNFFFFLIYFFRSPLPWAPDFVLIKKGLRWGGGGIGGLKVYVK